MISLQQSHVMATHEQSRGLCFIKEKDINEFEYRAENDKLASLILF